MSQAGRLKTLCAFQVEVPFKSCDSLGWEYLPLFFILLHFEKTVEQLLNDFCSTQLYPKVLKSELYLVSAQPDHLISLIVSWFLLKPFSKRKLSMKACVTVYWDYLF
ncbi:hypothetical protein CEXT_390531 [Caerostris extrusa]|uniref:Uncharacterized protein n=1 Tax=Caerostris extrusa TaxID=172846 RepID=A0AAV4YB26_CAEEX|nr:hypothetical protein CEXT_390531 [Caerostris extrusa]